MLVVNDVGDHDVPDIGIERRRLAKDVDAGNPGCLLRDLSEDVIRRHTQRVVDVENARARRAELFRINVPDPAVDRCGVEL